MFALGCVAVLLALGSTAARTAEAQSASQIAGRVFSAIHTTKVVKDSIELFHASHTIDLPPDSATAGGIRLRFDRSNLGAEMEAAMKAAAERAWIVAESQFGEEARATAGSEPILVNRVRRQFAPLVWIEYLEIQLPERSSRITMVRVPMTQQKLTDAVLDIAGTLATSRVPHDMIRWLGFWTPTRPMSEEEWQDASLDLATSVSTVTKSCYAGSLEGCESALGLTEVKDPLHEWYSPDGWRVLVSEWNPPKADFELVAAHDECVVKKVAATCERLARTRVVPIPLNMSTRATLYALSIERGGPAAFSKILQGTGTPLQILANASGASPNDLVSAWRSRVLRAAPRSDAATPGHVAIVLAWTLLFGVAASRRRP